MHRIWFFFIKKQLLKHLNNDQFSPVMALFSKQLLELAQGYHAAFDRRPIRDGLSTEVVRNRYVLTHLTLARLMPWGEEGIRQNMQIRFRSTPPPPPPFSLTHSVCKAIHTSTHNIDLNMFLDLFRLTLSLSLSLSPRHTRAT